LAVAQKRVHNELENEKDFFRHEDDLAVVGGQFVLSCKKSGSFATFIRVPAVVQYCEST
jgi:hypothetical protein